MWERAPHPELCTQEYLTHAAQAQERALRLVEIAGVDVNPCGGTHVASTAELQALRVVGAERARGGTRLRVLLGGRLLSALGRMLPREAALSKVSQAQHIPSAADVVDPAVSPAESRSQAALLSMSLLCPALRAVP